MLNNKKYFKTKAKEMAQAKLKEMSEEEIFSVGNKEKKKYQILSIIAYVLMALTLIMSITCFILPNCTDIGIVTLVFLIPCVIIMVVKGFLDKKKSMEDWALARLQTEYLSHSFLIEEDVDKNITKVTLLDCYSEVTDKLDPILIYQEIIQTRYYKFKVDYRDGHSEIITEIEGSARCLNLLRLVDNNSAKENKNVEDKTEELRKYKKLLDEGIITEEEFTKKKKQILEIE